MLVRRQGGVKKRWAMKMMGQGRRRRRRSLDLVRESAQMNGEESEVRRERMRR